MSPNKMPVEAAKVGTLYMQIMHFCRKEIGNLSTSNNDTLTRSQSLNV